MALDHALASSLNDGHAVLRLYGWRRPTVSFGRNEPAKGLYSVREAVRLGVDYVRRPTGGRVVLHDREVTYTVVAPVRALGGVRVGYRRINQALASALHSLGADVTVSTDGRVEALDAGPCFQSPAAGEVIAGGRKLVGSAQARIDGVLLQHGSIMVAGDQSRLATLSGGSLEYEAPATMAELVGPVNEDALVEAVLIEMESAFGGSWAPGEYDKQELKEADRLEAERYARDAWTWRR
jgi:lipoyl(octanoyl) transferase